MLRKAIDDDGLEGNWDTYIPGCLLAYNSSRHSVTGVTPFKAVFGHEPRLPGDGGASVIDGDHLSNEQFQAIIRKKNEARALIHSRMVEKIKMAQDRMRRYHRNRNSNPEFKVGEKVLLRNKKRDDRKGGKLESSWSSEVYIVDQVKGRSTYYLKHNGRRLKKLVNGAHLKKYTESE